MKPSDVQTRVVASQSLMLATGRISASFDSLSGWLAAGLGAALTLFLANLDAVSKSVSLESIRLGGTFFLLSCFFALAAKFLAALISAGTAAAAEAMSLGKSLGEEGIVLDIPLYLREITSALFWPLSAFARLAFEKAQKGDFAISARLYTKAAQIQVVVVIAQIILSIASVFAILHGFLI